MTVTCNLLLLLPVYFWASSEVHSDRYVGLDIGKMMGRSLHSPMAVNTSGVNRGPAPERPISMLGFTCTHRQTVSQEGIISVPDYHIHTVTAWEVRRRHA